MPVTATEADLRKLTAAVLRREIGPLTADSRLEATLGIDSLDVLRLLAAMEERYDIRISDERILSLRTYGDLLELLDIEPAEAAP
jgi:acyl carrier protein